MNTEIPCNCGDVVDLVRIAKMANKTIEDVVVGMDNNTYHTLNKCGWKKDMK